METLLITGGTGMLGRALTKALLDKGYAVIVLTRDSGQPAIGNGQLTQQRLSYAQWNVKEQSIDRSAILKADHIVHLAGASLAEKRWTAKRKQEIIDSRVKSGELLVKALKDIPNNVKTVISASAIGWYGPDPASSIPRLFKETDPPANNFLGQTCQKWEESIEPVQKLGKRLVKFRIGVVLSKEGGALKEFLKPLRFGIAAIIGSGRQVVSWIHIDDVVKLFITAIENKRFEGVYNAVAPLPVSNRTLIMELAKQKNGKWFLAPHIPPFVVKLIVGELSGEVLNSYTVSSEKVVHAGFEFAYPEIKRSVQDLLT